MRSANQFLRLALTLCVLGLFDGSISAGITYRMRPQSAVKPGWSFDGGFITTDGTLGEIGIQNLVDWTVKFTSPFGVHALSKDNGVATLVIESFIVDFGDYGPAGDALALIATEQRLLIPSVEPSTRFSFLDLGFWGDSYPPLYDFPMLGVTLGRASTVGPSFLAGGLIDDDNDYSVSSPLAMPPAGIRMQRMSLFLVSNDDTVAIVPEPTSALFLFVKSLLPALHRNRQRPERPKPIIVP